MATCAGTPSWQGSKQGNRGRHSNQRTKVLPVEEIISALDERARSVFCQLVRQVSEESQSGDPPVLWVMLSRLATMSTAERLQCLETLGMKLPPREPPGLSKASGSCESVKDVNSAACGTSGLQAPISPITDDTVPRNPVRRGSIAQTLAQLASFSKDCRSAIGRAGGITTLVQILRDGAPEERPKAVLALMNLVHDNPANQAALVDEGGIAALVALTNEQSASTELCGMVAKVISTLGMADAAHTTKIASAGGIAMLVNLCSTPACAFAVFALRSLALNSSDAKALIALEGGIPPLVRLLREGSPELPGYAAGALAALADGCAENQAAIVSAGGVIPLVNLLHQGGQDERRRAACALTYVALHSQEHQSLIAHAGAIPVLVQLGLPGNPCSSEAAQALAAIVRGHRENQMALIGGGGVAVLMELVRRGCGPAKSLAAAALTALIEIPEGRAQILALQDCNPNEAGRHRSTLGPAAHSGVEVFPTIPEDQKMDMEEPQSRTFSGEPKHPRKVQHVRNPHGIMRY